jgi:hypothetical protein
VFLFRLQVWSLWKVFLHLTGFRHNFRTSRFFKKLNLLAVTFLARTF